MRRHTVLIADDHAIVREGLVTLLAAHDFDVVGAVGSGVLLVDSASRLRPDVIITDISMPDMSGLAALARLKAVRSSSRIIVLTAHDDAELAVQALRLGASGFLLKASAGEELVSAIHQILQGRVYLTPAITEAVMTRMAAGAPHAEPQLTPRQLDVLRLILQGKRMKEIAATLDVSVRTVESHKYDMMETLGVSSTAELVKYAVERRLVLSDR